MRTGACFIDETLRVGNNFDLNFERREPDCSATRYRGDSDLDAYNRSCEHSCINRGREPSLDAM